MNKILIGIVLFIVGIIIMFISLFIFNKEDDLFMGLKPKATYGKYKIYDVVEQKGLPCAEAIEILDSDNKYTYYFNCLKSDQIYLVNDNEVIKVKDAYNQGIITKEKLYELNIISRMVSNYEE